MLGYLVGSHLTCCGIPQRFYLLKQALILNLAKRLLGHASIATTELYTHVSDEALKVHAGTCKRSWHYRGSPLNTFIPIGSRAVLAARFRLCRITPNYAPYCRNRDQYPGIYRVQMNTSFRWLLKLRAEDTVAGWTNSTEYPEVPGKDWSEGATMACRFHEADRAYMRGLAKLLGST